MSEQKYYVRFKPNILVTGSFTWLDRDREFSPACLKHPYTKSELAKIMDGVLYKRAPYGEIQETGSRTGWYHVEDDDSWDDEWINPLIEFVPVEDDE